MTIPNRKRTSYYYDRTAEAAETSQDKADLAVLKLYIAANLRRAAKEHFLSTADIAKFSELPQPVVKRFTDGTWDEWVVSKEVFAGLRVLNRLARSAGISLSALVHNPDSDSLQLLTKKRLVVGKPKRPKKLGQPQRMTALQLAESQLIAEMGFD